MDTARKIFDRIVRAACGFESENVRDDAVDFFGVRRRVRDMRVSISAFRPKKIPSGSFLHVSAGRT
jgi:hypothetical protein